MNLLILFVALAARAAAPNVGIEPAAAAPAATAAVQVLPEVQPVAAAATSVQHVPPVQRVSSHAADVQALPVIKQVEAAATPSGVAVYPSALPGTPCSLHDLLARRFLSGPWSAARRLEAARRRGDEAEARRMESILIGLVDEAAGM